MLMTTLMCGAMSIVMFSVYRSFRREVHGLGHWAAGLLLLVCASFLFGARGTWPDAVALLGANVALMLGIGLSMLGTEKFYEQPPSVHIYALACALGTAGIAWWLLVTPDFHGASRFFPSWCSFSTRARRNSCSAMANAISQASSLAA